MKSKKPTTCVRTNKRTKGICETVCSKSHYCEILMSWIHIFSIHCATKFIQPPPRENKHFVFKSSVFFSVCCGVWNKTDVSASFKKNIQKFRDCRTLSAIVREVDTNVFKTPFPSNLFVWAVCQKANLRMWSIVWTFDLNLPFLHLHASVVFKNCLSSNIGQEVKNLYPNKYNRNVYAYKCSSGEAVSKFRPQPSLECLADERPFAETNCFAI